MYLKAFLLSKGWQLRRTHDLQALLNEAIAFDASLERFRLICQTVSGFYMAERYPGTAAFDLTVEEVRLAEHEVMGLISKLRELIPPAKR
jgi:HEPN domain-containing protein